ncbi:alpha/beta fold hydrolase [Streptomyces sp. NPDC056194]|uniref:alpha/beta fold hydrolase n=1 Tax=unclassified Streptomyces TaxID=2593676 RepID=UPI0035E21076
MPRPALIPLSTGTPSSRARAAVLVLHGGRADDVRPLSRVNLPAWQMRPFASAIAGATAHDGVLVAHVRYRHRGWNGADAHPVTDTGRALAELRALARPVPVVLVGHSLGGRAALRAAAGAEGAIEALMAELAAERLLDEAGVDLLGGVHQAFKVVRRTIERREPLDWGPSGIDPCMAPHVTFGRHVGPAVQPFSAQEPADHGPGGPRLRGDHQPSTRDLLGRHCAWPRRGRSLTGRVQPCSVQPPTLRRQTAGEGVRLDEYGRLAAGSC